VDHQSHNQHYLVLILYSTLPVRRVISSPTPTGFGVTYRMTRNEFFRRLRLLIICHSTVTVHMLYHHESTSGVIGHCHRCAPRMQPYSQRPTRRHTNLAFCRAGLRQVSHYISLELTEDWTVEINAVWCKKLRALSAIDLIMTNAMPDVC
jgi:hypothetical protein